MPADIQKLWSCVGSAGVVNLPDVGKIVFNKSVAQLGPGRAVVIDPVTTAAPIAAGTQPATPAVPIFPTQTITAIIRYGVVPVEGVYLPSDNSLELALRLRYRDGAGHVLAKLIQVSIDSGTEGTLLAFDSRLVGPNSNAFQVALSPEAIPVLDFVANAYYVELTLTLTQTVVALPPNFPPAVSVVQLFLAQPTIF